jgi:hypothetical protein
MVLRLPHLSYCAAHLIYLWREPKGDYRMKYRIGLRTAANVLAAASVLLTPALQARQCSGNGDIVGSFGYTATRSGFYLIGAVPVTPPGTSGLMVPIPVTPPGTSGSTALFVGSNTNIGNLLTSLVNPNVFASVGRVFADGMGNLYASPTTGLMTNILAGSYNVNTNCSITMTLSDPFAASSPTQTPGITGTTTSAPVTLTGYVSANGAELEMIGTNGAIVRFRRISQGGNCNNSYVNGTFTISGSGFYLPSAGNGLVVSGGGTTVGQPNPVTTPAPATPCVSGQTGTGTAQPTCTGAFVSGVTGTLGTPFNFLARFVADGSGMLTTDFAGQQSNTGQAVTGTYAVNSDCTGTAHIADAAGITRNISFVLVNQAAQCYIGASPQSSARPELDFVFSDPGVIGSGTAQLQ